MKYVNQNQKGSAVIWIIAIVVIVIAVCLVVTHSFKPVAIGTKQEVMSISTVTIMVPSNLAAFKKAAVEHVQVGGPDPLPTTTFIPVKEIPNTVVADPLQNAAEAAAEFIPTQAGTSSLVVYFKVVNGTAYIVLNMDIDGWAGVSAAIAQVHPIVEKTLLSLPGITAVKFGTAPGDTIEAIQKGYMSRSAVPVSPTSATSDWKIFNDKNFPFTFKYPSSWTVKTPSDTELPVIEIQSPATVQYNSTHPNSTGGPAANIIITERGSSYTGYNENSMRKISFNGSSAYKSVFTGDGAYEFYVIGGTQYKIGITNFTDFPESSIQSQILSTFKFTN